MPLRVKCQTCPLFFFRLKVCRCYFLFPRVVPKARGSTCSTRGHTNDCAGYISEFFVIFSLRYRSAPSASRRSNKPSPVAEVWVGSASHWITDSSGACWAVLALPDSYTQHSLLSTCHLAPKQTLSPEEPQHCGVSTSGILPERGQPGSGHTTPTWGNSFPVI